MKATTAIVGPNDDIIIPKNSKKTDWEVELAIVIGKKASYVDEANAMDYVAGYVLHNDVSEREFQIERGGQWVKGKSCDTFAPIGPFFATKDEIADPHNLRIRTTLNGEVLQDGTSADMVHRINKFISYLSTITLLHPGDILATGTPSGVGFSRKPPIWMKVGDVCEISIDQIGVLRNQVAAS